MFTFVKIKVRYCRPSSWGGCCRRSSGGGGTSGLLLCTTPPAPINWSIRISGSTLKRSLLLVRFFLSSRITIRNSRFLCYSEVTPVFFYSVCQVGNSWEGGGEGEGIGGEGVLAAACEGGYDSLVSGPEVGAGHPGGLAARIIFIGGHNDGDIAGWIKREVLMLLEWARKVRAKVIIMINMSW